VASSLLDKISRRLPGGNKSSTLSLIILIGVATACTQSESQGDHMPTEQQTSITAQPLAAIAATATMIETLSPEPPTSVLPALTLTINVELSASQEVTTASEGSENVFEDDTAAAESTYPIATPEVSGTPDLVPVPITPTTGTNESFPIVVSITPTIESLKIDPSQLNGIPLMEIVVMDEAVKQNVKEIYAAGQARGRNPGAFSKLGDSLIATPDFLTQFDKGLYNLGSYYYLQSAIDHFAGSFERYGVALRPGLHAWGVFDPLWANKDWCQANENLLACEFRLNNPTVLLILLGSNDSGSPDGFDYNIRNVVEFSIENGVIPVIVTKADRFEGPENINNIILRQIAADFQVPLWDFDLVADTLPGRGLTEDQVHLTIFLENDYTMPEAYETGHGTHNLSALMVLEGIRQLIMEG
jgi:hypothetical protein